ncbi:hypothetical protein EGW08_004202 [Elysia chlorotica]|uniref:Laminin G domain-containing protein n=1 Tax=Elysia chlorotica TaxID=188477 RepID=A0A3S1BNV0_ELYCH|nr:hypothetical protein EGW08_004202 [Elysia chlorotica]
MYIADSLANPTNYFIVYFLDSTINVKMRSSLQEDITVSLGHKFNTGESYQVVILRINDYVAITLGAQGEFANSGKNQEIASTLTIDFARNLYFGGLGLNNLATSPLPSELKQTGKTFFAGAIYSAVLSNNPEGNSQIVFPVNNLDRATAPAVPQNVRYGLSLTGGDTNSYLGLETVATAQTMNIVIRLITSSASGLVFILSQETPDQNYIAVDVHQNELRLHLPATFTGLTAPAMLTLDDQANICDSQPHTLVFSMANGAITTTVDGDIRSRQTIPVSHALRLMNAAQFYVAGIAAPKPDYLPPALQTGSLTACITSVSREFGSVTQIYDPTQYASSSQGLAFGCPY